LLKFLSSIWQSFTNWCSLTCCMCWIRRFPRSQRLLSIGLTIFLIWGITCTNNFVE
jgi:hypothetical protein